MGRRQREVANREGNDCQGAERAVGMEATLRKKLPGNCPFPHWEVG